MNLLEDSSCDAAIANYRKLGRRRSMLLCLASATVVLGVIVDLATGPAMLSIGEVVSAFLHPDSSEPTTVTIIWSLRLPTAIFAVLIGGSLGVAGAEMQTVLNNPLASPFTLGVSAAASFGAAIAISFGSALPDWASTIAVPMSALAMTLLCSSVILGVGKVNGGSLETVILCGVALLFLFQSGVAFLQYIASDEALKAIVFWMFGSLQGASWIRILIVGTVLALSCLFVATRAWRLTALRLGDNRAASLGVQVHQLRMQTLIAVSILTSTAICFTGTIGFIGLAAPHIARMTVGEDQRFFFPMSVLIGAALLSAASIASKLVVPGAIVPLGILTSLAGVPFFFVLLLTRRRSYW